jgi:hypothetical protein
MELYGAELLMVVVCADVKIMKDKSERKEGEVVTTLLQQYSPERLQQPHQSRIKDQHFPDLLSHVPLFIHSEAAYMRTIY